MKIGNKEIAYDRSCFIIAEAGVNHNGELSIAKRLVDAAKDAGVDAVKFQTFKAEDIVTKYASKADYQAENEGKELGAESQLQMLKRLELSYDEFRELKKYCDEKEIIFLSTPHSSAKDVDLLDSIGVSAYKIGSGDLTNIPFLKYIANKGKPMILGTGMATMEEVKEALTAIYERGNRQVVMLHCTTNYPCPRNEVNLGAMQTMMKDLDCLIGYSDHTKGIDVSVMAYNLGACLIEKHFTLDKNMEGPDHKASLEPNELMELVNSIRADKKLEIPSEIFGTGIKKPFESEIKIAKIARKSLVSTTYIPKGTKITRDMLAVKRPEGGILPKYLEDIVGNKSKREIKEDSIIAWEDVE